ncbi:hypothetical protein GOBAR_DD00060 [Gossypium barbadense]|nr:hypothetical protein GOBAR_DD00060 [Gossypium barbadense]
MVRLEILSKLPVKSLTRFRCVCPCNGLLCLHDADKVAFWNPSTREFKTLPQSTVQRPPSVDSTSFGCVGIGFDSQNGDYKVAIGDSDYLILSFDMVNEKFSALPLPEFGGSLAEYYLELLDFNGLLGAIIYPREGTDKSFDLWVMNGSWTKQFSIESLPRVERPLGFWKNGELFLESSDHELVLFDPSTRELKSLGIHAYQETMQIITYVESLVPINGRSEREELIIRRPAGDASN